MKSRILLILTLMGTISPLAARAQQLHSIVAGISSDRSTPARGLIARRADPERTTRIAHDALVGAGIGIAIGLIASPVVNAQNSDHTEDGLTYVVLSAFGAFLGLIAGTIVGITRR